MEFVTLILTPVVESLLVPVKRHLGFLVSSSSKVADMNAKVRELEDAEHDMRTRQDWNVSNSRVVPRRVKGWLAEVEVIKASKVTIPTGGVGCLHLKTKYIAGKKSSKILKDITRLMNERAAMEWTEQTMPLGMIILPRPSTFEAVHEEDQNQNEYGIKSRDLIFKKALKCLQPNNNVTTKMMALCGMGGIGKTTMMEELKKVATEKKMFDYIVKFVVGQTPNPISIQQSVAEYLGEALTETTKDTRAERLKKRIENILKESEKKILVILDDVWVKFNLEDIGLASPLPNGVILLFTSRNENICNQMGVETSLIFKIDVLKEEEAKTLFWEITGQHSDTDIEPDMHQIGEDILKRCGGLPIAIDTIASFLKVNKKIYAWKDAFISLQEKTFHPFDPKAIFEISYMNLEEDDLKAIFVLCGLFPEDYDIEKENLLRYGWGLNLFKRRRTIASARERVHTCVDTLIGLNLLIKSDSEGCVKMHDLMRDFVLSNFSEVKQASIVCYDNDVLEHIRQEVSYERILLQCGDEFEFCEDFNQPNLALLTLMDGKLLKCSQDSFTNLEKLEVMAYKNMALQFLPQFSTNLRVLSLHSCKLLGIDISFIGDLINLEVLCLAHCRIQNIPSKLGKLKRLRLLDLTGCDGGSLRIDDGVIRNLDKLEELYMQVFRYSAIGFTDANYNELKMMINKLSALEVEFIETAQLIDVSFEKLERFRISMGSLFAKNEYDSEFRDKYSYQNRLMLATRISELTACKINELLRKTEILCLEVKDMSCLEDILMHPPHISFCNLKALRISKCTGLTYLFTIPVAKSLTKLESLEITLCDGLKSLVYGENTEAGVITFPKLKMMFLSNLQELVSLCGPTKVNMELPQLMELSLYQLPNITRIFPKNNINISEKQSLFNKEVVIPKLEKLSILYMKNLKEMWPCEITSSEDDVNNISMLREIKVQNCNSLENLFPCNPTQLLSHLEKLEVESCGSIEVLFNIEVGKIKHLISSTSNLRKIKARKLKNLREVWRIKDANNNNSGLLIPGFQSVRYLHISRCKRFTKIVSPTIANFDLRALMEIEINACGSYSERENELVIGRQEQEINNNTTSEEEISKVGENLSVFSFPSYHITPNLRNIKFQDFHGYKVVFEIDSLSNKDQLVINEQQPLPLPLLPYLEDFSLYRMDTLTHVWKCSNWNEFFLLHKFQPQSSFQNLTSIRLSECNSITYLFSPLMARLLSSLKEVYISKCNDMKEVVSNKDDQDMPIFTTVNTANDLFPHLELLSLFYMHNLKHVGGGVTKGTATNGQSEFAQLDIVHWSLCQYSRKISIEECNVLSSVIPYYATEELQKLQELSIDSCNAMEEVFETKEIDDNISDCSSAITVIPKPKKSIVHKLSNLKIVTISNCSLLEYLFTFSTLESLKKLETLEISSCKAMKVIIREEYGEGTMRSSSKDVVIFPNLKSITLKGLTNLEGFFLGMNIDFQWPLLDYVMIRHCPKIKVFTSGWSMTPRLKYIYTELGKHSLECGINMTPTLNQTPSPSLDRKPWSCHNLIECTVDRYHYDTKIFPSNELQHLKMLETVYAHDCFIEEVFEVALEVTNNESQTVTKFPKLREIDLISLLRLKNIWKSNQWRILEFPNLKKLCIYECISLEHVFTCSMVSSVMQLQELHIEKCPKMKAVIVKEDEDCEVKMSEIKFPCLKSLKLVNLKKLKGFFLAKEDLTLPLLDTLEIKRCPIMTVFTEGCSVTPI